MKTCPICRQAYSDEIEFCARDGALLSGEVRDVARPSSETREVHEVREERECPYCAERILKRARICRYCGRDVEPLVKAEAAVRTAFPAPPERVAEPPANVMAAAPPPAIPPQERKPAAPTRPPAPAKPPAFEIISDAPSNMKNVVLGGVALVVIVGIIWFLFSRGAKKGEVRANPEDGLNYVWIPSGTFTMGCSPGDTECYDFEKPPHQVTIGRGIWMGQTEVTVGAYKKFAAAEGRQMPPEAEFNGRPLNPAWGDDSMPIVEVTWGDAAAYCKWAGGRLPTEAEWEYAARADSTAPRYDHLDDIAWYADNSGQARLDSLTILKKGDQAGFQKSLGENGNGIHDVAQKKANALGLFDMLGNVWEWVYDYWDPNFYQGSPAQDPIGPSSGMERVLRGGSWMGVPRDIRVSLRNRRNPGDRDYDIGFRCGGEKDIP